MGERCDVVITVSIFTVLIHWKVRGWSQQGFWLSVPFQSKKMWLCWRSVGKCVLVFSHQGFCACPWKVTALFYVCFRNPGWLQSSSTVLSQIDQYVW